MGEYAALLKLTAFGAGVAGLLVLFHVRVVPRRSHRDVPGSPPASFADLALFQVYASLFVAFGGLALLLAAWAARVDSLGRAGLGVAALVTAPVLVGFAHLIARAGLDGDGQDEAGESAETAEGLDGRARRESGEGRVE